MARQMNNQMSQQAGQVWTIADSLGQIQEAINSENMSGIKALASTAADLTRALMGSGIISQGYGERVLESAGGYWNMAEASAKETASNASGAAANAQNSETVDQHRLSSSRGWAYCGIATSMMMLYANGKGDKNNVSRERDQLISEMYNYNVGTDVDQMAVIEKGGLDSKARNGTSLAYFLWMQVSRSFWTYHMTGTITK